MNIHFQAHSSLRFECRPSSLMSMGSTVLCSCDLIFKLVLSSVNCTLSHLSPLAFQYSMPDSFIFFSSLYVRIVMEKKNQYFIIVT